MNIEKIKNKIKEASALESCYLLLSRNIDLESDLLCLGYGFIYLTFPVEASRYLIINNAEKRGKLFDDDIAGLCAKYSTMSSVHNESIDVEKATEIFAENRNYRHPDSIRTNIIIEADYLRGELNTFLLNTFYGKEKVIECTKLSSLVETIWFYAASASKMPAFKHDLCLLGYGILCVTNNRENTSDNVFCGVIKNRKDATNDITTVMEYLSQKYNYSILDNKKETLSYIENAYTDLNSLYIDASDMYNGRFHANMSAKIAADILKKEIIENSSKQ